jgi:hypothetical protein
VGKRSRKPFMKGARSSARSSADILSAAGKGTFCPESSRAAPPPDRMSVIQQRAECTRSLSRVIPCSPPPDRMSVIQQRAECTRSLSRVIPRSPRRTECPSSSSAQNARAPCPESSHAVPAGQNVRHPAARRARAPCPESSRAAPAGQNVRHPAARRMHALRTSDFPNFLI